MPEGRVERHGVVTRALYGHWLVRALSRARRLFPALLVAAALLAAAGARPGRAGAAPSSPYTSPSGVSVQLSSYAAGATNVSYEVGFHTSATGSLLAGSGSVLLVAPAGTVLPSSAQLLGPSGSVIADVGLTLAGGSIASFVLPLAVSGGGDVRLRISPVTNAPSPGSQQLEVSTSSDRRAGIASFALTGSGATLGRVANVSLQLSTSAGDAAEVELTVAFSLPPTGGLPATGDVVLRAPAGTNFSGVAVTLTDMASGLVDKAAGATPMADDVLVVTPPAALAAGSAVVLHIFGVTNSSVPGSAAVQVATSADPAWVPATFDLDAPSAVTDVSASSSSPAAGATETTFSVSFRASAAGGMAAGYGNITVLAPPGEKFNLQGTIEDLTTGQSHSFWVALGGVEAIDGGSLLSVQSVGIAIHPLDRVELIDPDSTNPGGVGTSSVSVTTSSDTLPASGPFVVRPQGAVSKASVSVLPTPTSPGGATTFRVSFRTSSSGQLVAGQGQIWLLGPAGTVFGQNAVLTDLTTHTSRAVTTYTGSSSQPDWRWLIALAPFAVGPDNDLVLTDSAATATTLASTGGLSVMTSSDTRAVAVPLRTNGTLASAVRDASTACSTTAAGAAGATCTFRFVTSASGALTTSDEITVVAPIGFEMFGGATITDLTSHRTALVSGGNQAGDYNALSYKLPFATRAGDAISIVQADTTLPSVAGPLAVSIVTSTDRQPTLTALTTEPAGLVKVLSVTESSTAPGATGVTATFTLLTSPNGALAVNDGAITIIGPPGTVMSTNASITELATKTEAPGYVSYPASNGSAVSIDTREVLPGGSRLQVEIQGITNPASDVGHFAVTTSSDEALGAPNVPATHNRWISTIASSLPTPKQAFTPVKSIPANAGIAALVALFLSFPSSLFNQTFVENYGAIVDWWERRTRWLRRRRWWRALRSHVATAEHPPTHSREARTEAGAFAAVFVAGAVLACFNDPTFLRTAASIVTLPTVALSMALGIVVPTVVTRLYHERQYHEAPWQWHSLPGGLAIGLVCVVFSRLTHFEPGYLYGIVCSIAFTRKLGKRPSGHVAFIGVATSYLLGVAAWFAWVPVSAAANHHPGSILLGIVEDLLAAMFVGGVVGTIFSLLPVRGFAGFRIRQWNPRVWLACYFVVLLTLVQVLLRPSTRASAPTSHAPLVGTIVAFVVAAIGSAVFFEHFELKHRPEAPTTVGDRVRRLWTAASTNRPDERDEEEEDVAGSPAAAMVTEEAAEATAVTTGLAIAGVSGAPIGDEEGPPADSGRSP